jgi:succinoglycan biosynthesis transport protein ExoP
MPGEIDLRQIVGLLRRQLRVILAVFLAVLGLAALFVFTTTPIYTATTLVMVDPSGKNLLDPENSMDGSSSVNARIDGEVLLAASDNVLLSVIDSQGLIEDAEFRPELGFSARILSVLRLREPALPTPEEALRQTLAKLASMVSVQRRGLTFLIAINARSRDPEKAARLANAIAQAYIGAQLNSKVQSTLDARNVLLQQVSAARQAVVASEGSFDRYVETNLGSIVEQTGSTELARVQSQIADLSALRQRTSQNVDDIQAAIDNQNFSSLAERLGDEAIRQLERDRQDILGQISGDADTPLEVDLRTQLAEIEQNMAELAQGEVDSLQSQLVAAQSDEAATRQTLRSAILNSGLSADALTEIYDLQQQSELARRQYELLLTRSQQLEAEATLQLADSRVVSEALRPAAPSWPNTQLLLLLGAMGGMALGLLIAFLFENFVGGITTDDQLAGLLRTDAVVTVPKLKLQGSQTSLSDTLVASPLSAYSESIRRIRAYVDQAIYMGKGSDNDGAQVIVVTSSIPGEGKTTVSLSIARSYALAGRRTLLIDCDLRRPSVSRQLGKHVDKGLVEALTSSDGIPKISDAIAQDDATGLTVLMSSRRSGVPTDDLLTDQKFLRILDASRKTFDVIVLDTPPLGPVVDGLYLARNADAVLYVVQWAATSLSEVRRSMVALHAAVPEGLTIIPVLNQKDMSMSTYQNKYADYYHEAEA